MTLNRRIILQSMPAGIAFGALSHPTRPALGQSRTSTPEADQSGSPAPLEDALLAIEPDKLLSRLMIGKVTTPLLPSDTGTVEAREWTDDSDTDLFGTVGGVLMQTATDQNDNFIGPGVYIILRNIDDATERRESASTSGSDQTVTTTVAIGGFPGVTIVESGAAPSDLPDAAPESSAITILQVGYLLISGGADGPADGSTEFRSVANAVGLLDHLRTVVQAPA